MFKEKLLALADYLETIDDDNFDLDTYASPGFPEHHCGSAGCAIGHAVNLFPNEMQFQGNIPVYAGDIIVGYRAACQLFDLHYSQSLYLFDPYAYNDKGTRLDVIRRIRDFVS
jgi:hypothetical protein